LRRDVIFQRALQLDLLARCFKGNSTHSLHIDAVFNVVKLMGSSDSVCKKGKEDVNSSAVETNCKDMDKYILSLSTLTGWLVAMVASLLHATLAILSVTGTRVTRNEELRLSEVRPKNRFQQRRIPCLGKQMQFSCDMSC